MFVVFETQLAELNVLYRILYEQPQRKRMSLYNLTISWTNNPDQDFQKRTIIQYQSLVPSLSNPVGVYYAQVSFLFPYSHRDRA